MNLTNGCLISSIIGVDASTEAKYATILNTLLWQMKMEETSVAVYVVWHHIALFLFPAVLRII